MERRLPQLFFALSLLALALMLAADWQASTPSWKTYQRNFQRLEAQGEPNAVTKAAVLATPPADPAGVAPGLAARGPLHHLPPRRGRPHHEERAAAVPLSRRTSAPHIPSKFGCTICHGGQGLATDKESAHGKVAVLAKAPAAQGLHPRLLRPMPQGRRRPRRAGIDGRAGACLKPRVAAAATSSTAWAEASVPT